MLIKGNKMKLYVFKPKIIPRESFYLDYPKIKRSYVIFIEGKEHYNRLNFVDSILTKYIVFINWPSIEIRESVQRANLQPLDYKNDTIFVDR